MLEIQMVEGALQQLLAGEKKMVENTEWRRKKKEEKAGLWAEKEKRKEIKEEGRNGPTGPVRKKRKEKWERRKKEREK